MKTDKELTAEIVIAYLQSWHSADNTRPMTYDQLPDLINTVHTAIHSLAKKE